MMPRLKPWLLSLALVTTAAQAGAPWSWLNAELGVLETRQEQFVAELSALPPAPSPQPHEHAGFHSGFAPQADSIRWVQVDLGAERMLDAVAVVPAMLGSVEAYGFPLRFRVDASNDPLFGESTTLSDQTGADVVPALAPWHIAANRVKARYVRFTATKLSAQPRLGKRFIFCLGEMLVFSGGRNVALRAEVFAPNSVETLPTWSLRHLVDGCHALGLPVRADDVPNNGWHSAIFTRADSTSWVQADFGSVRDVEEIRLIPAHPRDYPDRFGFGFPRRFKVEADGKTLFDSTNADFPNPGDTAVAFPTPGLRAQAIRITATSLWERSADFVFALAELQAFAGGQNIALASAVTSSDDTITGSWTREQLADGRSSSGVLLDEAAWLADLSKRREISLELTQFDAAMAAAVLKAQSRAAYVAASFFVLLLGAGLMLWWRVRRSRRAEMEALRLRISRDLHDEIGSHLGSIRLMSELALREDGASESLVEIHRLAGEAAESMRGIIWLVREGDAPKLTSLVEAMRQSAAALLKGIEWHMAAPLTDDGVTASLEFHRQVFLFFREAAHNIARHAQAAQVKIELSWDAKRFHLVIQDDGRGFDVDAVTAGNGLANLRHRAEVLGGDVKIISEPGKGARIVLEAPLS
ncbi:MAG: histidine kinase [Prosthecobacter sp.]|nr:histidine kinase [Prosthecobacter sp.]